MTKLELFSVLAEKTGMSKKQAKAAVEALVSVVTSTLKKGDTVTLTGFGKFFVGELKARKQVVPRTNKVVNVPARNVPRFRAGKQLRDAVK
ncbi:MAG: HU family DNA-binding protein [Candidatus Dojkabacteria bacterium]|nr:MAG: HU family DNA-binding protein [Candidatus Dojkabacteria bacterium]